MRRGRAFLWLPAQQERLGSVQNLSHMWNGPQGKGLHRALGRSGRRIPRWAASVTLTTTHSLRRSTASTRPRSSDSADRSGRSGLLSSRRLNGSIGSITGGCWSPSAKSRRPKPRNAAMSFWKNPTWQRNSNQTVSDEPGTFQIVAVPYPRMALRKSIDNIMPDKASPNIWVVACSFICTKRVTPKVVPIKESANKKVGPRFLHEPA